MAELSISPDVIRDALKDFVAAYEPTGAAATEVGTVIDAADGIAHVEGLPGVMANELVTFSDGTSVSLNTVVDPTVVGGLRVQIADDVIDASVAARLADLRQRLAG